MPNLKKTDLSQITINLLFIFIMAGSIRYIPSVALDLVKYVYIAVVLLLLVFARATIKLDRKDLVLLLYMALTIIATIISSVFELSMLPALVQFLLINFSFLLLKTDTLKGHVVRFLHFFEVLVCVSVIYSVFLILFGNMTVVNDMRINYFGVPFLGQRAMGMPGHYGYSSFFRNPNPFGFNCVAVIIWRLTRLEKLRMQHWLELLLLCVGIYLSSSRAAYVCFALSVFAFLFFTVNDKRIRVLLIVLFIILAIAVIILFFPLVRSFVQGVDLNGRENTWPLLIQNIRQHPVFGTGYSSATKYVLSGVAGGTYNTYLNILCDSGFLGLSVFILFIFVTIAKVLKEFNRDRTYQLYCLILTVSMIALGFVENVFMNVTSRFLLWMICIYAIGTGSGETEK